MTKNALTTLTTRRPRLADSWLNGMCPSGDHAFAVRRTQDELKAAGVSEDEARAIRAELQSVFDQWRADNPERAKESRPVGLLGNSTGGLESRPFRDYTEFKNELYTDGGYPPLIALGQKHRERLEAVLMLSEAAAGRFESARKTRETLDYVLLELERDRTKALEGLIKDDLLPAATIGWKVQGGPRATARAKDRKRFQALAKAHVQKIRTTADLKRFPELSRYVRGYEPRTLATWLKGIGASLSAGRPKKLGAKG